MRTYQGKAGNKSREKSKGLNQEARAFIDARLKHIFIWEKDRFLDRKNTMLHNIAKDRNRKGGIMSEELEGLKPLLTVKQVAKILGLSEYSVRRYLKESKIKGLKLKRAWRMSLKDIHDWLHKAQQETIKEIQAKAKEGKK